MATNKIVLRSVEEFMSDYTQVYQPIFSMFLPSARAYDAVVGQTSFRRVEAVGDLRAKHVTPKDTEIHQIQVREGLKAYKRYFFATQYVQSEWQDREGIESVQSQVLDENQKFFDEVLMMGGTPGEQENNGLYLSSDPNYTLESSVAIASGSTRLYDFHAKVVTTATKANLLAGKKIIFFYGNVLPLFNSLYETAAKAWKQALQDVLGSDYTLVELPPDITPSGENGWFIVNLDQIIMHHTLLPQLLDQDIDRRKHEMWSNFAFGSSAIEVKAKHGIVRQPTTLA